MKPGRMMGRLADGQELGQGSRNHAVPDDTADYGHATALCGVSPGRRSGGWNVTDGVAAVTCPRCLKRLAKVAP